MDDYTTRTITGPTGQDVTILIRNDGATIPPDPNNIDYQAFLEWVAAGNTPAEWSPPE